MSNEEKSTGTQQNTTTPGRTPPTKGYYVYHTTHISNLPSIMENGLLCRKTLERKGIKFHDLSKRKELEQGEKYQQEIVNYVPFYFFANNPFQKLVCEDQKNISDNVIIAVQRSWINEIANIIPIQPTAEEVPEIYSYAEGFDRLERKILDAPHPDFKNPEVKRACLAECIIEGYVSPKKFGRIYVRNEEIKKRLLEDGIDIDISVNERMFF